MKSFSPYILALLIAAPLVLLAGALCLGRYALGPAEVFAALTGDEDVPSVARAVVVQLRLPRALLAMLVGAGLSVTGASFQGLFRNPLVGPNILGVAAGAGFGAVLGMLLGGNVWLVQALAFASGLSAVLTAHSISRAKTAGQLLMLVLAGLIVGAFFSALISLVKLLADPERELPEMVFWLMGSLTSATWPNLALAAGPIVGAGAVLVALRWRLNVLSLGEEVAASLGTEPARMRWAIVVAGTVATAAAVSLCGMVGWVGLVVPHIGRMLVGPDHRRLLPASISVGACYLLVIDTIARTLTPGEIPLSILTAIIGAPFFGWLLLRTGGRWA